MSREQLLENLKQLHQLLQDENHPDSETRALLETATADIQKVLSSTPAAGQTAQADSLSEQLRVALLGFESRHPQISGLIERITDGLAGMGI
jgi:Domain of unknown function (DUF4404)